MEYLALLVVAALLPLLFSLLAQNIFGFLGGNK